MNTKSDTHKQYYELIVVECFYTLDVHFLQLLKKRKIQIYFLFNILIVFISEYHVHVIQKSNFNLVNTPLSQKFQTVLLNLYMLVFAWFH